MCGITSNSSDVTPRVLLILAMTEDIWLDQVKFSLIITSKNLVKQTCSMVTEFINMLDPMRIFFLSIMKNNVMGFFNI